MFKRPLILVPLLLIIAAAAPAAFAQTVTTLNAGMLLPTRIATAADNSLLVTEAGTVVPNTGRISVLDRTTGERRTLVSGLPSGVNNLGGPPTPSGPTALVLSGNTLFVTIGPGDAVMNVGPGLEMPNPSPSSALYDSVLRLTLPGGYQYLEEGFALSLADQDEILSNGFVVLTNSFGQQLTVSLVVNLPDYRSEPRPDAPDNVKSSNLYGIEIFQKDLYVVDASFNHVQKIRMDGSSVEVLVTFPNKPNPLFPTIGGPVIEPVPDAIHRIGNTLLVPLLTGFPFVQGFAEVKAVSLKDGSHETLIPGLTSAIDVMKAGGDDFAGKGLGYYTLEFSSNQLASAPGRIKYFGSAQAPGTVVVPVLITPTSMTRDDRTGDVFVTEMFTSRVVKVSGLPY